jgi:hypothetical protein
MLRTTLFSLAACFAGNAAAQMPARPDPADPKAAVPARPYESAFKDYRPYADPEVARWRQSNEETGRLGGHVGHLPRETGTTAKPGAKPPGPASHGGHK